jgi:hypothetical protein
MSLVARAGATVSPNRSGAPPTVRLEQPNDLSRFRVPLESGLLEDRRAVLGDLEPPAPGGNQLDLGIRKSFANLGGQTGRSWFVVSHRAVFDPHAHVLFPRLGFARRLLLEQLKG